MPERVRVENGNNIQPERHAAIVCNVARGVRRDVRAWCVCECPPTKSRAPFCNFVVSFDTDLGVDTLTATLHDIENACGPLVHIAGRAVRSPA